ncbi:MAG: hypothetical protein MUC87_12455 [Bacteroidia bacterium]|jgi:hypothetical protein|nr:hypothetical protein [Bacteroidia bacterium]
MRKHPWIHSPLADGVFVLSPPLLGLLLIFLFPQWFGEQQPVSTAAWVILVLCIDVAHVYSTLYRTYFDKKLMHERRWLLLGIPAVCYVAGVLLCLAGMQWFWRVMAYIAVFHFVRQQYGFMRIYSRREARSWMRRLDAVVIYATMLYPLLWWHLHPGRDFHWFVAGDFVQTNVPAEHISFAAGLVYLALMLAWAIKEVWQFAAKGIFNLPRTVLVAGTALSWYFGIVYFNGDMTFTLLNVVSHGIPYMALIWFYGRRTYTAPAQPWLQKLFSVRMLAVFAGLLLVFAFAEEWLWDALVWQERPEVFGSAGINVFEGNGEMLALIVPLLALPQVTHYVLDGFIWRISKDERVQQML